MKTILISGTAMLALALPGSALAQGAPTPKENAAKTCKALKKSMSASDFAAAFGTNKNGKNAYGKCVSKQHRVEKAAASNAAKQCKAERDDANFAANHDGMTFEQVYGTNKNGKNAYGKCVSSKARAANAQETRTQVKATKTCKSERKELGKKAFTAKYGGKKNAFGKCISAEAKAARA